MRKGEGEGGGEGVGEGEGGGEGEGVGAGEAGEGTQPKGLLASTKPDDPRSSSLSDSPSLSSGGRMTGLAGHLALFDPLLFGDATSTPDIIAREPSAALKSLRARSSYAAGAAAVGGGSSALVAVRVGAGYVDGGGRGGGTLPFASQGRPLRLGGKHLHVTSSLLSAFTARRHCHHRHDSSSSARVHAGTR